MPNSCEATVSEYFAAIRALDVEGWVNTFAPDAISHDPVGAPPHVGHEGLRRFLGGIASGFSSVGLVEDHIFLNGNSAAVKWTGNAVAHNGRSIKFEGVDVIDCNAEGKITTVRAFWNPTPVMALLQD